MSAPHETVTGRVAQLCLWRPPGAMTSRVVRDRDDPAGLPVVVLSYGDSQLEVTVNGDVEIAEVYRQLDEYAATLRRRHRETRRQFQARYAPTED